MVGFKPVLGVMGSSHLATWPTQGWPLSSCCFLLSLFFGCPNCPKQ